jgi:hypothetical protein
MGMRARGMRIAPCAIMRLNDLARAVLPVPSTPHRPLAAAAALAAALALLAGVTANCGGVGDAASGGESDLHARDGGAGCADAAGPCASPLAEGTACAFGDAGAGFCNNGTCGPWTVAAHHAPPAIPLLGDGGAATSVSLYVVTFDGDPLRRDIEAYASWLGSSSWISVLPQYGFKSIDSVTNVELRTPPPVADPAHPGIAYGPDTMSAYAQSLIDVGAVPPAAPNVLYAVFLPHQPNSFYAGSAQGLCKDLGYGYHSHMTLADGGLSPLHVLVETECDHLIGVLGSSMTAMQTTFSHELAEWAMDADDRGYRFPPTSLGGTAGPESADMCSFTQFGFTDPIFGYQAVPVWSNEAIAAGQSPCQPWNSKVPFANVDGPSDDYISVTPGQTLTVPLVGWATAPTTAWRISTIDQWGPGDFEANPVLGASTITNGGHVAMSLTIPATATSGQKDVVWIESSTLDQRYVAGWMVGLSVK